MIYSQNLDNHFGNEEFDADVMSRLDFISGLIDSKGENQKKFCEFRQRVRSIVEKTPNKKNKLLLPLSHLQVGLNDMNNRGKKDIRLAVHESSN
jgi:hypothetical protein